MPVSSRVLALLAGSAVVVATWAAPAGAQGTEQLPPRSTAHACPPDRIASARFPDVTGVHREAVDCLVHWQVTRGQTARSYAPAGTVTRGQVAGFLHRTLVVAEARLAVPSDDHFSDDAGTTFEQETNALAEAGVVRGRTPTTYEPSAPVTRAEMATLVRRAVDLRLREAGRPALPAAPRDPFRDDAGVHEPSVNALARAGVVSGFPDGTYRPGAVVRRDQMASFLARALDVLVEQGTTTVPPAPGVQPTCDQALAVVGTELSSFRTFTDRVGAATAGSPWRPGRAVVLRGVSTASGDPVRETFDAGSGLRGDYDLDVEAFGGGQPRRVLLERRPDGSVRCEP